jgi:hypothetical protein
MQQQSPSEDDHEHGAAASTPASVASSSWIVYAPAPQPPLILWPVPCVMVAPQGVVVISFVYLAGPGTPFAAHPGLGPCSGGLPAFAAPAAAAPPAVSTGGAHTHADGSSHVH